MFLAGGRIDRDRKTCSFSLQYCIGAQHIGAVGVAQGELLRRLQEKTSGNTSGATISCRS